MPDFAPVSQRTVDAIRVFGQFEGEVVQEVHYRGQLPAGVTLEMKAEDLGDTTYSCRFRAVGHDVKIFGLAAHVVHQHESVAVRNTYTGEDHFDLRSIDGNNSGGNNRRFTFVAWLTIS